MKKTLSLILAMALLFAMALPAAAETQTLTVNYSAPEATYVLTIPADQTITDSTPNNIGMVGVASSSNFFNRHLTVECQISEFKGATNSLVFPGFLAYHPKDGEADAIDGNGQSVMRSYCTESSDITDQAVALILEFNRVEGENGALVNQAHCGGVDVDFLWAHTYLSNNKAPSDTYKATITYTASVNVNS